MTVVEDQPKPPKDFHPVWMEHSKAARSAQVDYGRWIVNTLWLMHSGSIAGLLSKWNGTGPVPKPLAIILFAAGILFAFAAAAAAWFNSSVATVYYDRFLYGGDRWFDVDGTKDGGWMRKTMIVAMAFKALSVLCLVLGVAAVLTGDATVKA